MSYRPKVKSDNQGTVTDLPLDAETVKGVDVVAQLQNKSNVGHTHSSNDITQGYLNVHPENSPTLIPFMNNDIAFLLKRGGSAIVKKNDAVITKDISNCFDGSPTYCGFESELSGATSFTIELTLHKTFTWGNTVYVDFGNSGWRAKSIKLEVMNSNYPNDVWTQKGNTTTNASGHYSIGVSHTPVGGSSAGNGFNKIRYTFSVWNTATIFRIAQIGIYNYSSGSLRETSMSRGIDDYIFRNITPNANNTYKLGDSTHKWSEIHGALKGTADNASKLNNQEASYYLNYNNLNNKPTIPSAVTEATVSGWGFTKNTGTVTSVSAGTGLSISGTASTTPTVNVADGYKLQKTISTQDVRITDLQAGTYVLTYSGKIRLYWNGAESDDYVEHLQSWSNNWNPILVVQTTGTSWFWQCYNFISLGWNFKGKVTPSGNAYTSWQDCKYFVHYTYPDTQLGSKTKPIYLETGTSGGYSSGDQAYKHASAVVCDEYAGGTKVTLNGTNKGASEASFWAPVNGGGIGQFLKSSGTGGPPSWVTVSPVVTSGSYGDLINKPTIPTKSSWNYDDMYVKWVDAQELTDAQKTQARNNIGAGTSSLAIGTTASTAAAGNHTHGTTLATDSGTATVTMEPDTTYKLSTGGTNVIFKTPSDAYKIVETLRKGSEADTAVGYYKIATINHVSWNFCDFCMLLKNSYSGTAYSTVINCSCSDSNVKLQNFNLEIISGTDISNKLAYLYTYDSNNNLIKVEVFIHATRFEHPMCYIINARPGQQLVIPTQDEFNKANPDLPDGTTMTGYATCDNRGLLNHELGVTIANTTTDSGWSMFHPTYTGYLLQSVRFNANSPAWGVGDYGSGIVFGGEDTKGVISLSWRLAQIKFAGGNSGNGGPVWWIGLTGTSAKSYDLDEIATKQDKKVTGSWAVSTSNPGPMVDIILAHPDIKIYYRIYVSGTKKTTIANVLYFADYSELQNIYTLTLRYINAGGTLTTIGSGTIYYEYFD